MPDSVGSIAPPLEKLAPSAYSQFAGSVSVTWRLLAATVEVFLTITRHVNAWLTSALALAGKPEAPVVFSIVIVGSATLALTAAVGPVYSR